MYICFYVLRGLIFLFVPPQQLRKESPPHTYENALMGKRAKYTRAFRVGAAELN